METLTIQPKTSEQLQAIKAILKAMKIPFEKTKTKSPYDAEFVKKINVVRGKFFKYLSC